MFTNAPVVFNVWQVYFLKQGLFSSDWKKLEKFEPTIFTKKFIKACITTKARLVTRPDDGSEADNRMPGYEVKMWLDEQICHFEQFPKITKRLEEASSFLTIMIHIRQVDLIAEENHPFSQLHRSQHDSIRSSSVLAVMVKCLKE